MRILFTLGLSIWPWRVTSLRDGALSTTKLHSWKNRLPTGFRCQAISQDTALRTHRHVSCAHVHAQDDLITVAEDRARSRPHNSAAQDRQRLLAAVRR